MMGSKNRKERMRKRRDACCNSLQTGGGSNKKGKREGQRRLTEKEGVKRKGEGKRGKKRKREKNVKGEKRKNVALQPNTSCASSHREN